MKYPNLKTINTSPGGLIVKNSGGTVEAFIDTSFASGGQMKLKGDVIGIQANESNNVLEVRYDGNLVGAVDKNGNLQIASVISNLYQDFFPIP